jgi:hypothetical protein
METDIAIPIKFSLKQTNLTMVSTWKSSVSEFVCHRVGKTVKAIFPNPWAANVPVYIGILQLKYVGLYQTSTLRLLGSASPETSNIESILAVQTKDLESEVLQATRLSVCP